MQALSCIVGRRAVLRMSTFKIWPPLWVLLLGDSGVGKSCTMEVCRRVVEAAGEGAVGWTAGRYAKLTPRGFMEKWQKLQEHTDTIEGIETIGELSGALVRSTGTEDIMAQIIEWSAFDDIRTSTGYLGESVVTNFTAGIGACSVIDTLMDTMSVNAFTGGFLHRFITCYEREMTNQEEEILEDQEVRYLAHLAQNIRINAPEEMHLTTRAQHAVESYKRLAEDNNYRSRYMTGFWHRYPGLACKLGITFALSDGHDEIDLPDIERAHKLLSRHIYPALEALVIRMSAPPTLKAIFNAHDDLAKAREYGLSESDLFVALGASTPRAQAEMLAAMQRMNLVYEGTVLDETTGTYRYYGTAAWRSEGERD